MLRALFRLVVAALIGAGSVAHAQGQTVHRCIGEHGEIVFSGLSCRSLGVTDAPAPQPAPGSTEGAKPLAATTTCVASIESLRTIVADAMSRRDPNALAGLMRWDGIGGSEARERLRDLASLASEPLLGIDVDGGAPPDSRDPGVPDVAAPPSPAALVVRTGSTDGTASIREHAFAISATGGCYWLDW